MKEHIISYIQDHEEEIVRLSTELIGANTVNPTGNEYLAVNIIKKYFNAHDIKYDIFEKITGRAKHSWIYRQRKANITYCMSPGCSST